MTYFYIGAALWLRDRHWEEIFFYWTFDIYLNPYLFQVVIIKRILVQNYVRVHESPTYKNQEETCKNVNTNRHSLCSEYCAHQQEEQVWSHRWRLLLCCHHSNCNQSHICHCNQPILIPTQLVETKNRFNLICRYKKFRRIISDHKNDGISYTYLMYKLFFVISNLRLDQCNALHTNLQGGIWSKLLKSFDHSLA